MSNKTDLTQLKNRYGIVGRDAALNEALSTAVQVAHTDCFVVTVQGVVLQLIGQTLMGHIVFCRDDQAGSIPVNAVDNARTQLPVDSGE